MNQIELKYEVRDEDTILTNKTITNPDLYPELQNNLRKHISNILPRTRFWWVQNNIKIFDFLIKETEKQLEYGK